MFVLLIAVCVLRWGFGAELIPQNSVSSPPNTPPPSLNWKAEETSPVSTNPNSFRPQYICDSSSPRSRSNLRRWNKICAAGCCWLIGRYLKPIWRKILANNAEANFPLVQRDTENVSENSLRSTDFVGEGSWRAAPPLQIHSAPLIRFKGSPPSFSSNSFLSQAANPDCQSSFMFL